MLKLSEELEEMSASGDFGVALDGVHERVAALEIERDALKAELDRLPAKWSEDSSLKTWFPITCDYLDSLRAEMDELKAKLKSTESRLHEVAVGCANAEFELEAARKQEPCGYMCEDACITTIYNAAKCTGDFSKHTPVYKSPVPAQQAESPWHVITNENWNIPKLGQRVILFSNGAIQNDSYTLDRGDDGYFWSRDDVDECPEVKAGDAWMPWPSEFRGVE